MRNNFRFIDRNSNWLSILMIVLGLVLALWPDLVMNTAMIILGIALLAGGALSVFSWYRDRALGFGYFTLAEGVLLILAGIFVLSAPMLIISILPIAVGVIILVNGVINLAQSLDLKRAGYPNWVFSLVLAVVTAMLGVIIIFNPFSTMEMLLTVIGIFTIYNGASNLWINTRFKRL